MSNGGMKPQSSPSLGNPLYLIKEEIYVWDYWSTKFFFTYIWFSMVGLIGICGQFCCGNRHYIKNSSWYLLHWLSVNLLKPTFHFNQNQKLENVTPQLSNNVFFKHCRDLVNSMCDLETTSATWLNTCNSFPFPLLYELNEDQGATEKPVLVGL